MNITKPIFDLIFFRHPVIVLILSFLILYLAGLLNSQNEMVIHHAKLAVKNGPPEIVRIEGHFMRPKTAYGHEVNVLAEIDLTDMYKFTVDTNSTLKSTKYIIPLYAATKITGTKTGKRTALQVAVYKDGILHPISIRKPRKKMIGAIISNSDDAFDKVLELSDGYGKIGPIVTVNGQHTLLDKKHERMTRVTLATQGIRYNNRPIYIDAFFGNRDAIIQKKIKTAGQTGVVYIVAYILMAIAYIRCLWQMIAAARRLRDPSLVNAVIKQFDNKPQQSELIVRGKTIAVGGVTSKPAYARTSLRSNPFNRINRAEETIRSGTGSIFGHKARKA